MIPNVEAFFFLKQKYGYSIHFVVDLEIEQLSVYKWYELQLKQDFHDVMAKYGMIPNSELKAKFELL